MKERGILFSATMVRALLDGTKTQTRRVVKAGLYAIDAGAHGHEGPARDPAAPAPACPYGQPGERLWVRETFFAYGRWDTRYNKKKERDEWYFIDMTRESGHRYRYAAGPSDIRTFGIAAAPFPRPGALRMPSTARGRGPGRGAASR